MKVPSGYTEKQVLDIIDRVVNKLANAFTFGAYDADDIKQEGRIFALKVINDGKYNPKLPLENFLYTHVRNRYINLKRNKFARHEPPCTVCPFFDKEGLKSKNNCAAFLDKMECSKWALFITRNATKRNINEPIDLGDVNHDHEDNMKLDDNSIYIEDAELKNKIDAQLDVSLRSDYLKLLAGCKLPKTRRDELQAAIKLILLGADEDGEE